MRTKGLPCICQDVGSAIGAWDAGDTVIAEYRYDGLGRRIVKLVRDAAAETWARTDYYYNERWQVVEERFASGLAGSEIDTAVLLPHVQYLWGAGYVDTPICRFRDVSGDGDFGDAADETVYYTTDANHNVTAVVTPAGVVLERYLFDPYGRVTVLNGNPAADPDGTAGAGLAEWTFDPDNASDVAGEVLYAGYRFDPETGLYQVRWRYYHPTLGRFITRDPDGYGDGLNVYQYCHSGPMGATDPMGLDTWQWVRRHVDQSLQ